MTPCCALGLTIALWAAHGTAAPAEADLEPGPRIRRLPRGRIPRRREGAARGRSARSCATRTGRPFSSARAQFYDGDYRAARAAFERASHAHGGRPAAMAPFRIADCLWMEGDRAAAAKAYAGLRQEGDADDGRRGAGALSDRRGSGGARSGAAPRSSSWPSRASSRPIRSATRRCARPRPPAAPAVTPKAMPSSPETAPAGPATTDNLSVPDRLKRAESLTKDRHWDEALVELDRLPAALPATKRPSATTRSG